MPRSETVTVTVWVLLKNRPKVTVFRNWRKGFPAMVSSASGGVISATPVTVMVRSPSTLGIRHSSKSTSPMPPGVWPLTSRE